MPVLPIRKKKPAPQPATRTVVRQIKTPKLRWLNFVEPTEADIRYIERNFSFHRLDIADLRSTKQRPKIDEYGNYLFIIFHAPFYDRRTKRLIQEEIDVFVGPDYLLTLHSGRLKILNEFFQRCYRQRSFRDAMFAKGAGYLLYEIISRLFENSFPMLDRIAERINVVEREILGVRNKEMTEELSHLKLEIINFRRIIRPQRTIVEKLEVQKSRLLPTRLDIYFDDVLDAIGRTTDLLENYKEVVESLEDTNETFIQHRINNVVKVLTIVSLITLPGATISGMLAMNLKYPFAVNETTFYITVAVAILFAVSLFSYMYRKKWL